MMNRRSIYDRFPKVEQAAYRPDSDYDDLLYELEEAEGLVAANRPPPNNFVFGLAITTGLFGNAYLIEDAWLYDFVRSLLGETVGGFLVGVGFAICALFWIGVAGNLADQRAYRQLVERAEDRLHNFRIGLMLLDALKTQDHANDP